MTHAYLHNLANAKPELFTGEGSPGGGKLLSCLHNNAGANGRFVFATGKKGGKGGAEPEEDDEEKKKEKDEEEKKEKSEKEKKKKEEEEKEKKKAKEKDETEGEEEENLDTTQQRISEMARSAVESSEKIQKELERSDNEKERANAEKMRGLGSEFKTIDREDIKAQKPTKDYLSELVTRKKITKSQAKTLLNIDPADPDFTKKWKNALKKIPGLESVSTEAKKLLELKEDEGEKVRALDKRLKKAMNELRELSKELEDLLIKKAYQKRELEALERSTGLGLKPGQVLKYHADDEDKKEKKLYSAVVKEIKYEEIDVQDDEGNVVRKVKTNTPVVVVESLNPTTNKLSVDTFNSAAFHQWADEYDVHEDIDSVDKLNKSIGVELKEGNVIEYQEIEYKKTEKEVRTDVKVEIKKLDKEKRKITLDKQVKTPKGPKNEFSFDEFAKWFKKNEVVKEIENLEKLRHELHAFNEKQNSFYERPPGQYPTIEAKDGETLYYDDGTNREFIIKKVHEKDKKIEFEGGKIMTLAAFLRWVKRNEVEKKTGDAEAHKASDHIEDPKEKELQYEKEKAKTEREMKERQDQILDKPEGTVFESPDEHAHASMGYMRRLWRDTHFLSINDLGEMAKTIWELIKRRWNRRQKGRIGTVGKLMFGFNSALGAEFKSISQAAENEEVNHHVHVMETMGIEDIKHELHHPPDRDTLKAAITVMCKKGQMRWDDHHFWHALELFSGESIRPDHYLEDIEKIVDGWWGQDTFREFRNSGDSSYNSIKKNFEDNATRLENDPNGLPGELRRLLFNFINGEYVNPCQFEEYLDYAMKAGKMVFEDKMFFLIMGIGATNPNGETLLHLDRVAALEGTYLNIVPLIDFFISPLQFRLDAEGNRIWDPAKDNKDGTFGGYKTGRPDLNTFKGWIKKYIQPDIPRGKLEQGSLQKTVGRLLAAGQLA